MTDETDSTFSAYYRPLPNIRKVGSLQVVFEMLDSPGFMDSKKKLSYS